MRSPEYVITRKFEDFFSKNHAKKNLEVVLKLPPAFHITQIMMYHSIKCHNLILLSRMARPPHPIAQFQPSSVHCWLDNKGLQHPSRYPGLIFLPAVNALW